MSSLCEQADAAQLDEVVEASFGLAPGVGVEQLVGMGRGLEGQPGQGEVTQVHQFFSLSFCMASGDGRGSGAGSSGWACQEERSRLTGKFRLLRKLAWYWRRRRGVWLLPRGARRGGPAGGATPAPGGRSAR